MHNLAENDLWTFVVGLFGGIGATLLWEVTLKPMHARMRLAEVLSAEVSHNMQILGAQHNKATAKMVHSDFSVSTMVFDAVVADLGLLPTGLIGDVVLLYRHFGELNRLRDSYSKYVDDIRNEPGNGRHVPQLKVEIQQTVDVFNVSLVKTMDRVNRVQPRILSVAFPWWSSRTWFRKRSKSLSIEEMQLRTQMSELQRNTIAANLRERDSQSDRGSA